MTKLSEYLWILSYVGLQTCPIVQRLLYGSDM